MLARDAKQHEELAEKFNDPRPERRQLGAAQTDWRPAVQDLGAQPGRNKLPKLQSQLYRDKTEASLQKLRPNLLRQVFQAKGKDADVEEAGEGLRPVLLGPAPWHAGGGGGGGGGSGGGGGM